MNPRLIQPAIIDDFRNFLYLVWKHLKLPDPTPVQYDIAHYLQHGPDRQIIQAFRGVGKSWETSAFVCWSLLRDPQARFLVVSASKQRSDDFSTFTLRLIHEMEILQHLKPGPDQRQSKIAFDVRPSLAAHAPSVKSVGVFGQMTGSRATHIIADDVEVAQNSQTEDMREKLIKAVLEFEAIANPKIGRVTFLGTPQTEESIYNKLRERGYKTRIWPAEYPTEDKMINYGGCLAPMVQEGIEKGMAGKPTDPSRFDELVLMQRKALYGAAGYALQFMLDTSLSDAERYPLKLSDLIVMPLSTMKAPVMIQYGSGPEQLIKNYPNLGFTGDRWYRPLYYEKDKWADYEGSVLAIDPAGRGKDETGYAVVKQLHGNLFLLEAGGLAGGYDDSVLLFLAKLAAKHCVTEVTIEANFGDGMYTKLIQPILRQYHDCAITEVKHSIQKEKRIIDTLEPVLNAHRLIINEDVVKNDLKQVEQDIKYSLFYQMTRLTRERGALANDDRIDALAIAVAYWVEAMARDNKKATDAWEDREAKKVLKALTGTIFEQKSGKWKGMVLSGANASLGKKPRKNLWVSVGR